MFAEDENTRKIQKADFSVLKTLTGICDKQGIKYYLYAGTLLGAVRHKGFIPWDDDIDLCMPREELDRLVSCLPEELPEHYNFEFRVDIDIWGTLRISDTEHILRSPHGDEDLIIHPCVDIFPLDGMPEGALRQKLHLVHALVDFLLFHVTQVEYANRKKDRPPFHKALLWLALHIPVWKLINKQKALERLTKTLRKYEYAKCAHVFNFYSDFRARSVHPKSYYLEGRLVEFEDMFLRVPLECEKILSKEYGDYMTPPPEAERKPKHGFVFVS